MILINDYIILLIIDNNNITVGQNVLLCIQHFSRFDQLCIIINVAYNLGATQIWRVRSNQQVLK